ncbi:serine/threonine-protein kinase [Rubrivirga marina]|uniref:Protein kinase domain-containing protein n=1 Tax=Rubrivirga marina TaxID=1196024 RepID=A0A271IVS2_9BACT|nr:serine/threonine-protein kinase [Rubrivirga marina]PAP75313.1 hypothetical protein BSZ37_02070 [Rubrivirga marina]
MPSRPTAPAGSGGAPAPDSDKPPPEAAAAEALFDRLMDGPLRLADPVGPEAPERVGDWELGERIGQGGLSTVYEAVRPAPAGSERAAVKLAKRLGAATESLFSHEAGLLGRLRAPGLARLLDAGTHDDGRPYIALERIEGQRLSAYARSRNAWERLLLLWRVCQTVEGIHLEDVVHGDLKPDHLLVRADGTVAVLDLGLARDLRHPTPDGAARRLGLTPEFAAPEQILGGDVGREADVYALGLVIREVLEGRRRHLPWAAGGEGDVTIELPDDARAPSGVPLGRYVGGLLRTALQTDPARRFPTAGALAQALDDVFDAVMDGTRLA